MATLPLGSFARDLYSVSDTVHALIGVLKDYDAETAADYLLKVRDLSLSRRAEWDRVLKGILHRLNHFVPPYSYAGHHIADVANWGVWIDFDRLHRAEREGKVVQGESTKSRSTYVLDLSRGVRLMRRKGWQVLWETT